MRPKHLFPSPTCKFRSFLPFLTNTWKACKALKILSCSSKKNPSAQFRDIYGPESVRTERKRLKRFQSRYGRWQINPGITLTMCFQDLGWDGKDEAEVWTLLEHSTVMEEGWGDGQCVVFEVTVNRKSTWWHYDHLFFPGEASSFRKFQLWQAIVTPKGKTLLTTELLHIFQFPFSCWLRVTADSFSCWPLKCFTFLLGCGSLYLWF